MKRIFFFIVSSLVLGSCMKQDSACKPLTPKSEEAQMLKFAEAQNLTVQKDPSGIYYQIIEPGSGQSADLTSKIFISYKGQFLDGTALDEQTDNLNRVRYRPAQSKSRFNRRLANRHSPDQKRRTYKMIIPSSLAYGCTGKPRNTANEILYFDVTLTDIQ